MNKWVKMKRVFAVFMIIAMALSIPCFSNTYAMITDADLPATATGSEVTNKAGATVEISEDFSGNPNEVESWTDIGFTATFTVNTDSSDTSSNNMVQPGDYIIVDWPDAGNGNAAITPHKSEIPLKEKRDGVEITYANAYVTEKGAVIVFTDAVLTHRNINGYVDIWGKIKAINATTEKPEKFTITVNGKTIEFDIYPADSTIGGDKPLDKWGQYVASDNVFRWDLNINETASDEFGDTLVEDHFGTGHELAGDKQDGQIELLVFTKKGSGWYTVKDYHDSLSEAKQTQFKNYLSTQSITYSDVENYAFAWLYYGYDCDTQTWTNDTRKYLVWSYKSDEETLKISDYISDFSTTPTSITANFPANKIQNHFMILTYYTQFKDDGYQEIYSNEATLTYTKGGEPQTESISKEVKYNTSSGGATGIAYDGIEIKKTLSTTGEALKGIYFKITKQGDDNFVKYVVTNSSGIARYTGLTAGTYYVTELTEAEAKVAGFDDASYPEGLVVDKTSHKVTIGTNDETTVGNELELTNSFEEEEEEKEEKKPLLSVKKTSNVKSAKPGNVIPYTIAIKNKGDGDAKDALIVDVMDDNLEYVSDDSNGTVDGQTVNWTVDVPAGTTKKITINCIIKESASGKVVNNVEIKNVPEELIETDSKVDAFSIGITETKKKSKDKKKNKVKTTKVKTSRTGDDFYLSLWAVLMLISASALVFGGLSRRRKLE